MQKYELVSTVIHCSSLCFAPTFSQCTTIWKWAVISSSSLPLSWELNSSTSLKTPLAQLEWNQRAAPLPYIHCHLSLSGGDTAVFMKADPVVSKHHTLKVKMFLEAGKPSTTQLHQQFFSSPISWCSPPFLTTQAPQGVLRVAKWSFISQVAAWVRGTWNWTWHL